MLWSSWSDIFTRSSLASARVRAITMVCSGWTEVKQPWISSWHNLQNLASFFSNCCSLMKSYLLIGQLHHLCHFRWNSSCNIEDISGHIQWFCWELFSKFGRKYFKSNFQLSCTVAQALNRWNFHHTVQRPIGFVFPPWQSFTNSNENPALNVNNLKTVLSILLSFELWTIWAFANVDAKIVCNSILFKLQGAAKEQQVRLQHAVNFRKHLSFCLVLAFVHAGNILLYLSFWFSLPC